MNTLVVLFALASVACGSLVPFAQPAHHPALVLDPHGRPLDTAEVINARALHLQAKALDGHYAHGHAAVAVYAAPAAFAAPTVYAAPAAVSHQSRVDVHNSPAIVNYAVTAPLLAHSAVGYAAHGHYLHKRSLGHFAYAAPAAVSHQSRVDVHSSPAVVSHAVAAPVFAHAAPVFSVAPAAVSHQSRVDVRTSPAVVTHAAVAPIAVAHAAPVYSAYSALAAPVYSAHAYSHGVHAYSHLLKKRSLAYVAPVVHTLPSAVSHQSRVDVISKPAVLTTHVAPAVYAAPAVYSAPTLYAASVVSHITPIAHSAIWSTPLLKAAHW